MNLSRTSKGKRSQRLVVTLVAALAFFVQSFVTQTHIHIVSASGEGKTMVANAIVHHDKNHDPFPAKNDPANCPLCQEIAHAGHYTAPSQALEIGPTLRIAHVVPVPHTRATEFVLSHAWRSRAPPTA